MSANALLDSDSDDEREFSHGDLTGRDRNMQEEISLWRVCDIFEEIKDYTTSAGLPILDSRDAIINLYDELNGN